VTVNGIEWLCTINETDKNVKSIVLEKAILLTADQYEMTINVGDIIDAIAPYTTDERNEYFGCDWIVKIGASAFEGMAQQIEEAKGKLEGILVLAGLIAGAIAAWKIGSVISDYYGAWKLMNMTVGELNETFGKNKWGDAIDDAAMKMEVLKDKIKRVSGIALIIAGLVLLIQGYSDAWVNGLDWKNFALILGGIALTVTGIALAISPAAAAVALIVGGIAALVIGIKDLVTNGYSMEAVIMVAVGAILVLVGVVWALNAALLANPITWIVVAIMALVAVFVILWNECEGFRNFWINLWEGIKSVFSTVWEAIKKFFTETIPNIFNGFINFVKENWQALLLLLVNPFAGAFKLLYDNCEGFRNFIDKWVAKIGQFFKDLWTGIKNVFAGVGKWFADVFTGAWNGIKKAFAAVGNFFSGIWNSIKAIFSKVGSTIGDAVSGAFKTAINWVLEKAIGIINGFLKAINLGIDIINAIPGVEIKKLAMLEVPKLAKGGITTGPTTALIGEAGREAVLPLDNNTGWIDMLADRLAERNGAPSNIVLMLDGKELGHATINSINNITRQTGSLQLVLG
jgi:phage-related protein